MSQLILLPPVRPRTRPRGGTWCDECGYSLRGLPPELPCPECGHLSAAALAIDVRPHVAWGRSVFVGLLLLVLLTPIAISSVLIQPSADRFGGSAALLNLPGPKLWAVPLLQRSVGERPQAPGVTATRTAMLSLLAIWLITAPCPSPRVGREQLLRLMTRWGSVALFGPAFGTLMASQGFWPSELPPYRQALVGAVELPAAALLYLYLRRLARQVPGRERRATFDRLAWWVPLVILAGAILLGAQWWIGSIRGKQPSQHLALAVAAPYGAVAMLVGVAATAAVASLAAAYFRIAFPSAQLAVRSGKVWTRRLRAAAAFAGGRQGRALLVAGGLLLLLVVMLLGNESTLWITARKGVAGNLPFVNYPGPKMWASTSALTYRLTYRWDPLVARTTLLALNVLAIWLITMPLHGERRSFVAAAVRALSVTVVGAALTFTAIYPHISYNGPESYSNKIFMAVTIGTELPVTVLLYVVLARLSERCALPRLAWQFRLLCFAIVLIVCTSMLGFVVSKFMPELRGSWTVLIVAAAYGAASMAAAAWATAAVLRLAGAVLLQATSDDMVAPAPTK
ncbi:MAG TPA: hypothetical protein VER17_13485 [Tepidisphaeraceae bacterium]|nr:hypothetical protein [Tepidisphaeraceae bacterium]